MTLENRLYLDRLVVLGLTIFIFFLLVVIALLYENILDIKQLTSSLQHTVFEYDETIKNTLTYKISLIDVSSQIFIGIMQSIGEEEAEEKVLNREHNLI